MFVIKLKCFAYLFKARTEIGNYLPFQLEVTCNVGNGIFEVFKDKSVISARKSRKLTANE